MNIMDNTTIMCILFVLGSIIGSFLNVCIVRLPEKQSIVFPGSHCPRCKTPIPFYWNIPLVSYILLGARCRHCGEPISFRYFVVELASALTAAGLFLHFGLTLAYAAAFVFTAALLVITFIDLTHQIIPDSISLPGIPLCFACSFMVPWTTPLMSLLGIVVGGGTLYVFAAGYKLLTGIDGMGGGDIKLLAMAGAFLGWKGALTALIVGALSGSIVGVAVMAAKGKNMKYAIPFGPFLAFGSFCALLWGERLISWYLAIGS